MSDRPASLVQIVLTFKDGASMQLCGYGMRGFDVEGIRFYSFWLRFGHTFEIQADQVAVEMEEVPEEVPTFLRFARPTVWPCLVGVTG